MGNAVDIGERLLLDIPSDLEVTDGMLGLVGRHYQTLFNILHEMNNHFELSPIKTILCLSLSSFCLLSHHEFFWAVENVQYFPVCCGLSSVGSPKNLTLSPAGISTSSSFSSSPPRRSFLIPSPTSPYSSASIILFSPPALPPLRIAQWMKGIDRYSFFLKGRDAIIVRPMIADVRYNKLDACVWICDFHVQEKKGACIGDDLQVGIIPQTDCVSITENINDFNLSYINKEKACLFRNSGRGKFSCWGTEVDGKNGKDEGFFCEREYMVSICVEIKRRRLSFAVDGTWKSVDFVNFPAQVGMYIVVTGHAKSVELVGMQRRMQIPKFSSPPPISSTTTSTSTFGSKISSYSSPTAFVPPTPQKNVIDYKVEKEVYDLLNHTEPPIIKAYFSIEKAYEEDHFHFANTNWTSEMFATLASANRRYFWNNNNLPLMVEPPICFGVVWGTNDFGPCVGSVECKGVEKENKKGKGYVKNADVKIFKEISSNHRKKDLKIANKDLNVWRFEFKVQYFSNAKIGLVSFPDEQPAYNNNNAKKRLTTSHSPTDLACDVERVCEGEEIEDKETRMQNMAYPEYFYMDEMGSVRNPNVRVKTNVHWNTFANESGLTVLVGLEVNMREKEEERTLFFGVGGRKVRVYCQGLPAKVQVYSTAKVVELMSVKRTGEKGRLVKPEKGDRAIGWGKYMQYMA